MHEVGLMQDALDIAIDHAARADATVIRSMKLRVGDDSGVVPDSLTFAFSALAENTIASGAKLEIETVPVRCYCQCCDIEFTPADIFYECPICDKPAAEIRAGREFQVVSVEVD